MAISFSPLNKHWLDLGYNPSIGAACPQAESGAIVHRVGTVELGEASIAVAVSSPHRADSFEAGRWLVDVLKTEVPIWKREYWADGSTEWVHPDGATPGQKETKNQ